MDFSLFCFDDSAYYYPPLSVLKVFVIVKLLLKAQMEPPALRFSKIASHVIISSKLSSQHIESHSVVKQVRQTKSTGHCWQLDIFTMSSFPLHLARSGHHGGFGLMLQLCLMAYTENVCVWACVCVLCVMLQLVLMVTATAVAPALVPMLLKGSLRSGREAPAIQQPVCILVNYCLS